MRSSRSFLCSLILLVILPVVGLACSVPVFRYAIEHWNPDGYVVRVYYQEALTDQQQKLIKELQGNESTDTKPNLNLVLVDVNQPIEGESKEIWKTHRLENLPAMLVHMPASATAREIPVWKGPLSSASVQEIVRSPLRRQIEKRLVDGESVVWVQLDSGKTDADDAAFKLLQAELERLEKVIELPKIEEADLTSLSVAPSELKIRFSALRVPAKDPQENVLREMLRSVEADLRDESVRNLTMAIPVFGRGRALYALTGEGINPSTIEDACRFLTGACQCTVKAENPGVDLLLSANWESLITVSEPKEVDVELVGLGIAATPGTSGIAKGSAIESVSADAPVASQTLSANSIPGGYVAESSQPDIPVADQVSISAVQSETGTTSGLESTTRSDTPARGIGLMALAMGTIGVGAIVLIGLLLLVRRPS